VQGLVRANGDASRAGFLPLWASQAVPLIRDLPAARLIETFVANMAGERHQVHECSAIMHRNVIEEAHLARPHVDPCRHGTV